MPNETSLPSNRRGHAIGAFVFRLIRGDFARHVLVPLVISRLALVLIGWMAIHLLHHVPRAAGAWEIGPRGNIVPIEGAVSTVDHSFINMWSRWDAGWYVGIAQKGYHFNPEHPSNAAFFPAYPMLIRAAHLVVGSHREMWWFVSGIIVSNVALLVCLCYFLLLVRLDFDEPTAHRAVLYFLVFPTTLFFSAVYSESVFLAFVIGSFYHARKGEWWRAGLLGALATLSRPPGIVILAGLGIEYLLQRNFDWRKIRWNLFALLLVPLALVSYLLYLRFAHGTAAAAVQAQFTWGLGLRPQWHTLAPFFQSGVDRHGSLIDFSFTLVSLGLVIATAFRLRASYAVYAFIYWVFITLWGSLESIPRYILGLFPMIILLALFGQKERFDRTYVAFSAALAGLFMAVFAVWGWVA